MTSGEDLTAVETLYLDGRATYRVLFGKTFGRKRLSRERNIFLFNPRKAIGYLRWRANEYGTQSWRCFVVRTLNAGDRGTIIPGVKPCAEILLATRGATYTKRFLKSLDRLKQQDGALETIPYAYWRHLHLRLHLNLPPHELSPAQWACGAVKSSAAL